jgi:four helix bundle protein
VKNNIQSYKDLIVWQKSIVLVDLVYTTTNKLPDTEKFGLVSQINRSAVSIPSNIAEGAGRSSRKEFVQFIKHARGSLFELETQLIIVKNRYTIENQELNNLLIEISKMISVLIKKLETEN